ncbi:MAG TPA: methyl-accepting chemotaxis protein [Ramlibacter sp.]|uniref:methyl-accepting chemotaxis protein n=1 Tax=Ramlibacter sp. TaxID=1917967 RepID=UPI002ECFAF2C
MSDIHFQGGGFARRVSIRVRLAAAFGVLIFLMAAMAGIGTWRLAELDRRTNEMATVNLRVERVVGEWLALTRANLVRRLAVTRTDDPLLGKVFGPELAAGTNRINELTKEVETLVRTPAAQALLKDADQKRQAFLQVRKQVADLKSAEDHDGANAMLEKKMVPAQNAYIDAMQALRDHYTALVEHDAVEAAASARTGRTLLVGFCLAGALLALLASWLIARSITRPLDQAVEAARRVADGDLTVSLAAGGRDEMTQMLRALGDMTARLRTLVGEVAQGARSVADTSAQIAQGNADLSQRTEEQASTLEETASSIEELTSTVGQNADNARVANELAAGAAAVAREGGSAVGQVVTTMTGISASSRKIAEIIGVIDGIAFQTNILALNAAVEAARAGEQGRGFAVVASEVRNLAQRSAQAAKEIKALIGDSVRQVEAGTAQVDLAGRKMQDIVQSVTRVSELIAEIASASQEQSSGIGQVNVAIAQMDQVVQQNASLVEEAAAATESMKGEAAVLLRLVGRFHVGERDAAPVAAATIAPIAFVKSEASGAETQRLGLRAPAQPAGEWRTY